MWILFGLAGPAPAASDEIRLAQVIVPGAAENEKFSDIAGLAFQADGALLFADGASGRLFRVHGETLQPLAAGGKPRLFGGRILGGIAPLAGQRLAVTRPGDDQLAVVDDKGETRFLIGESGGEEGRLSAPVALAASARGRLYVSDRGNHRVSVYTHEGIYLFAFPGRVEKPAQIAVDGDERVYVLDADADGRVLVFDHSGKVLKQFGARELHAGEARTELAALAVDRGGRLLLADRANGKLIEYDWQAGKLLRAFGSRGAGRGQFADITALALADSGALAVGDSSNKKIELYQLPAADAAVPRAAEVLLLPALRTLAPRVLDCDQAWALPKGEALCLNDKDRTIARLGADGKPLAQLAGPFRKPRFATADARDIAVIDGDEIKVFAFDGRLRFRIGRSGSGDGEFDAPAAVLLVDRMLVADSGNRRVQLFSRDGVFLDKLVNPKDKDWLRQPEALARDEQGNLYVADNALRRVRVFSSRHEPLYDIGADEKSPQRFEHIQALALDADDQLYVLAATAANGAAVQMYSGPKPVFRFGSAVEKAPGFTRATSLAFLGGARPALMVFDAGRRQLQAFAWLQVPSRVGGLVVRGEPKEVRLRWQRSPGSTVDHYRVYGAAASDGPWRLLKETADTALTLAFGGTRQSLHYRVSAVSGHEVEGPASQAREDLFRAGLAHYQVGRYAEATARFAQAWKDDATHAAALEYLGRSLAAQGRRDDALRHYQELARLDGHAVVGVNLQAETLLGARDYAAARAVVDPLTSARRGDATTFYLCGQAALALGDSVTAADCLEQSVKLERNNAGARFELGRVYLRMGAANNGFGEIDAATGLAPQDAALWLRAGTTYQNAGRSKDALERFQRALALDANNAAARLGAARAHIALKEYDKARAIAQSLAGADEAAGQYLLGTIALALKSPQEAVLALSKAAARDPKDAATWLALADAQHELKNDTKEREALRQAVTADPASFDGWLRLGRLEQEGREPARAVEPLEKAVALQPAQYDARLALGSALLALGHYREAGEQAREAVRLGPKRGEPLLLLADASRAQGKYGETIDALKKVVALNADSASAHLRLGQAYSETDAYDLAQAALERAALLEPKNPAPHDLLGRMYLERRMFDPAIKALTRATELGNAPEYRLRLDTAYAEKKKALEFSGNAPRLLLQDLRLERVFSAAYKRYAEQPVGSVKVSNVSGTEYKNLKLSFHIKGYMDFPQAQEIALLPAGDSVTLPLHATFNNKILGIDEDTGVQVEVRLSYFQNGQPGQIELTRPMTLYGKNAILWADFRMVGAFVTPRDETLKEFVRQSLTQYQPPAGPLNKKLLQAMTLFDVLSAAGLRYQADPNSPYSKVSSEQVDYVQFPRETLRLKSGDCDDLSVLLAAALENLGIETALVDVPGHLFLMFNTGVPAGERDRISLQDDLLAIRNGEVWVPLEATLIATSFAESWTEGARKLQEGLKAKNLKVVPLKDAWSQSVPVTLAPAGYTISPPTPDKVQPLIERERRILVTKSIERLIAPYRAMLALNPADATAPLQIAILYAQNSLYDAAFREFDRLLAANPRSSEAHNDRGNIYYTLADYDRALEAYAYAEELDPADGGIKLNLALVHYQRGRLKEAAEKYREAVGLNPALAGHYQAFQKLLAN